MVQEALWRQQRVEERCLAGPHAGPSLTESQSRDHRKGEVQLCWMPLHVSSHSFGSLTHRQARGRAEAHGHREDVRELQQQGDLTGTTSL
jgi:hypothetical protein